MIGVGSNVNSNRKSTGYGYRQRYHSEENKRKATTDTKKMLITLFQKTKQTFSGGFHKKNEDFHKKNKWSQIEKPSSYFTNKKRDTNKINMNFVNGKKMNIINIKPKLFLKYFGIFSIFLICIFGLKLIHNIRMYFYWKNTDAAYTVNMYNNKQIGELDLFLFQTLKTKCGKEIETLNLDMKERTLLRTHIVQIIEATAKGTLLKPLVIGKGGGLKHEQFSNNNDNNNVKCSLVDELVLYSQYLNIGTKTAQTEHNNLNLGETVDDYNAVHGKDLVGNLKKDVKFLMNLVSHEKIYDEHMDIYDALALYCPNIYTTITDKSISDRLHFYLILAVQKTMRDGHQAIIDPVFDTRNGEIVSGNNIPKAYQFQCDFVDEFVAAATKEK